MGASPPALVAGLVERKTGTVPDCGRVRAAGDCPEFSGIASDRIPSFARTAFLSPDYKEEQPLKVKTSHEQDSLKRAIAATDSQIDALACEMYGLTQDEVAIVGGGGV